MTPLSVAPPSDIRLSSNSIPEDAATGTVVADSKDGPLPLSLATDSSGRSELNGDQLTTSSSVTFNLVLVEQHVVTVRAVDASGRSSESLSISVTDVNIRPINLELSSSTVQLGAANGTVVGLLTSLDPEGRTVSYRLDDSASGAFAINTNKLWLPTQPRSAKLQYDAPWLRVSVNSDD